MSRRWVLLLLTALTGCAVSVIPPGLVQIEEDAARAAEQEGYEGAAEAWNEVGRLTRLARNAAADGDPDGADRFVALADVETARARALMESFLVHKTLAGLEAQHRELVMEEERLAYATQRMDKERERAAMRAHIEQVISSERRLAAAQEELREARLNPGDKEDLSDARREVGAELLARARVMRAVAFHYSTAGSFVAERLIPVDSQIGRAAEALAVPRMTELQEALEDASAAAQRLIDESWGSMNQQTRQDVIADVAAFVGGPGPKATEEQWGISVEVPLPRKNGGDFSLPGGLLGNLVEAVGEDTRLHLLVVVASGSHASDRGGQDRSNRLADKLRDHLVDAGISSSRVSALGTGPARPLRGLTIAKDAAVILLLPVPVRP